MAVKVRGRETTGRGLLRGWKPGNVAKCEGPRQPCPGPCPADGGERLW